jgi:hypothetical protein
MTASDALIEISHRIANAIAERDVQTIGRYLPADFVHRAPGGALTTRDEFLRAIAQIPGTIAFVRVDSLAVDLVNDAALVSGVQHARVIVDGQTIDDQRAFVDYFVKDEHAWRLRMAFDVPAAEGDAPTAETGFQRDT